jgi:hypothetical protein
MADRAWHGSFAVPSRRGGLPAPATAVTLVTDGAGNAEPKRAPRPRDQRGALAGLPGLLHAVRRRDPRGRAGPGLLLGGIASLFAGGIPYLVLAMGVRRGRFSDMHLSRREERPVMLAIGLASVSVGLGLMALLDAPRSCSRSSAPWSPA